MAENKTKPTAASVSAFIESVADPARREDCRRVAAIMSKATGEKPKMWGSAIVGFGSYHYEYESGREGDSCVVGFSPRKDSLTLYLMGGVDPSSELFRRLGTFRAGKGCLYIKRLEDVDADVLSKIVKRSVAHVEETYTRT